MQAALRLMNPNANVQRVVLQAEMLVGRSPECQLKIASSEVSRKHCRLSMRGTQLFVEDLKSSNGTVVNGKSIPAHEKVALSNGDQLMVGPAMFVVEWEAAAKAGASKTPKPQSRSPQNQPTAPHYPVEEIPAAEIASAAAAGADVPDFLDETPPLHDDNSPSFASEEEGHDSGGDFATWFAESDEASPSEAESVPVAEQAAEIAAVTKPAADEVVNELLEDVIDIEPDSEEEPPVALSEAVNATNDEAVVLDAVDDEDSDDSETPESPAGEMSDDDALAFLSDDEPGGFHIGQSLVGSHDHGQSGVLDLFETGEVRQKPPVDDDEVALAALAEDDADDQNASAPGGKSSDSGVDLKKLFG